MSQVGLIAKLLLGIVFGMLIGTYSGDYEATQWVMYVVVFLKTILRDLIQFFLPLIMISFVSVGIAEIRQNASGLLKFTVGLSYVYTIVGCTLGALAIYLAFQFMPGLTTIAMGSIEARALPENIVNIRIPFPFSESLITSILLGFVFGIGMTIVKCEALFNILKDIRSIVSVMIKNVIIPIVPFYIGAVFAEIAYKGDIWPKIGVFGVMLVVIVLTQWLWLFMQYLCAGTYSKTNPAVALKTMLPAYFTAFGTTSSAVSMPVSLARGKLIKGMRENVANFVFPLCSQTHLSGAGMAITISALTVSMITGQGFPSLTSICLFILLLGIIEVGAVGVPGGSIMAAWPILVSVLGFDDTAMGIMFALFLIQDSFGTAANIAGDGSIAMIVNKRFGEQC